MQKFKIFPFVVFVKNIWIVKNWAGVSTDDSWKLVLPLGSFGTHIQFISIPKIVN